MTKKNRRGLDGRQLAKNTQQPNQKQAAAMEGTMEGRRDEQEAWGSAISLFFGGGEVSFSLGADFTFKLL